RNTRSKRDWSSDVCSSDLAFALHPGLEPVVEAAEQRGALAALVSGSGPTIAILVEDEMQARTIAAGLMGDSLVESCLVARGSAPNGRASCRDKRKSGAER